ncbi:hypothetical protein BDR05DRAFT_1000081 [Suillus weaverae]|nr:hypothetical protein BDR05DRAFT_1000081 [Suillus weaverae]
MSFKFTLSLEGFAKLIPTRLKRPRRTQRNSTTAGHEGDSSIPTDLSNPVPAPILSLNSSPVHPVSASSKPVLEEPPTGFPSTGYPWGTSPAREASDIAQVALPLVQAFTGVIPLVGAPIHAVIGGLLGILQVIDRCDQNKAALDDLTSRLYRLYYHLCNAPPALDPLEHSRRDFLARKLQDTSARLRKLQKRRFVYTSVTQAIAGCLTEIDRDLMEFSVVFYSLEIACIYSLLYGQWSSQMQMQHEIHELHMILRGRQEGPQNVGQSFALGVTLVDATGHHHSIPVNFCTSYQQLNNMLRVLFQRNAIEAQIQGRYIEEGKYDLCIDEGTQVTPLTNHEWSSIEPGTTIVMRVTIQQMTSSGSDVDYKCRFCGAVNRLDVRSVKYQSRSQRRTVCSTDCRECKRRFQITRNSMGQSTLLSKSNPNHTTEAETLLIRNFHVQQIWVRDLVFRAS